LREQDEVHSCVRGDGGRDPEAEKHGVKDGAASESQGRGDPAACERHEYELPYNSRREPQIAVADTFLVLDLVILLFVDYSDGDIRYEDAEQYVGCRETPLEDATFLLSFPPEGVDAVSH